MDTEHVGPNEILQIPLPTHKLFRNLTGQKIGRLTVIGFYGARYYSGSPKYYYTCECECGKSLVCVGASLKSGNTKSCGCWMHEVLVEIKTKHNSCDKPEYIVWAGMIQRCTNPKHKAYSRYGGRGVVVDPRWLNDFMEFYNDLGPRPSPKHSIERVDNEKGYSKDNCRWATAHEQAHNTSRNKNLTHDGRTMCVSEWEREMGLPKNVINQRLGLGWSVHRAITEGIHPGRHKKPQ